MSETREQLYHRVKERLRAVTRSPAQAGAEADMIAEALLGLSASDIFSRGEAPVPGIQVHLVEQLLYQRIEKRIPIQYLLHRTWFYGLKLYVNPHVLIPRPETELLVEKALELARPGTRILDIGTGSGAIPLALSHKLGESAVIVATDISEKALQVARINQKTLGTNVDFRQGDLLAPVAGECFDGILSNPPYVDWALRPALDAEVASHEPEVALFAPEGDAYYFYRRLAREGKDYLKPGGWMIVEMGAGMADAVRAIFEGAGWRDLEITPDYAGIERMLTAHR